MSADAIRHRTATGRLTPVHRGVYRLGETHIRLTSLMAAVLASGPAAVLSHHAAAELHGLRPERGGPIDVTVARGHPESREGVRVHCVKDVESTRVHGVPVTTVERTVQDLAAVLPPRELQRVVDEAQIQRKLHLTRAVGRAARRRGARALRPATRQGPRLTRSEAERKALELIEAAGLPRPETNVRIGRYEVDLLWREERVVVEIDGFAFHGHRAAFEHDRGKDLRLAREGIRVLRITWRQLVDEPERIVALLAGLLAR